jgi:hypothetical protein
MRINDDRLWLAAPTSQYVCTVCGKTAVDSPLSPGNPRRKAPRPAKKERRKPPPCPVCGKTLLSAGKLRRYCNPLRVDKNGRAGCGKSFSRKELGEDVDT